MEAGELPEGWAWASIDDLVGSRGLFRDGDWVESKDQDPNGDIRLIQLADIGDGEFRNKSARFLTAAKAAELGCSFLREGDLLIRARIENARTGQIKAAGQGVYLPVWGTGSASISLRPQ